MLYFKNNLNKNKERIIKLKNMKTNIKINRIIDHTNLDINSTEKEILNLINEAKKFNFFSICIHPCWIKFVKKKIYKYNIKICTVIDFPFGLNNCNIKKYMINDAIKNGVDEVDLVININFLKSGYYNIIINDIKDIINYIKKRIILKIIIEVSVLTNEEKKKICKILKDIKGIDFIKTSTGFFNKNFFLEKDVLLIKSIVKDSIKIKASGGIKTKKQVLNLINIGVSRIGTSSSLKILNN